MSHLEYYVKHGISPVRYDLGSLESHFQRRGSLYRSLGLLPLAFRDASVLEVAAGSGQNSLYVASLMPRSLTLLEPNPTGIRDIKALYKSELIQHTTPRLIDKKLEDYNPSERFDIVICENWLGSSTHERGLLRKLGTLVNEDGILVVTAVNPIGFMPNIVRRALAAKICPPSVEFEERTTRLAVAFSPHLATMASMTRNAIDWIHDNLMNPAYFDLCLTIPMVLDELGQDFQSVATNPSFTQDWRWFKSLEGSNRNLSGHLLKQYWSYGHNFLDYRVDVAPRCGTDNRTLEMSAVRLIELVQRYEQSMEQGSEKVAPSESALLSGIDDILKLIGDFSPASVKAFQEATILLSAPSVSPEEVADMRYFSSLFGRETLYLSLLKFNSGEQCSR